MTDKTKAPERPPEPSDAERAEWKDATRAYVEWLEDCEDVAHAMVAAAYEAAAAFCRYNVMATRYRNSKSAWAVYIADPIDKDLLDKTQMQHQGLGYEKSIRALTPADARAALDRLIEEARNEAFECAAEECRKLMLSLSNDLPAVEHTDVDTCIILRDRIREQKSPPAGDG